MPEEDQTANQQLEDGAQDAATQTAEDSAQQTANQTDQDGADRESEGLKQAAVAEKKKRQELENRLLAIQSENAVLRQQAMQSVRQTAQLPENSYQQALRELGLQDESYLTVEQQAQVFNRKDQLDLHRNRQMLQSQNDMQFIMSHPDYNSVVGPVNPMTGQRVPSEELSRILMEKPYLSASVYGSAQAAYDVVMQERQLAELKKLQSSAQEQENRRNAEARMSPMSPTETGGAGDESVGLRTFDQVAAMEARVKAGEFDR